MSAAAVPKRPVRAEEALDVPAVDTWLKARVPGLVGTPEVTQYTGGASNWTYRLRYPEHDLVLRRPPAGTKAKSAHDMGREYRVQAALQGRYPVPEMIGLCEEPEVLGVPFYVMRRVPGLILRAKLPRGVSLSPETARALSGHAIDHLAALHRIDPSAAGLGALGRGPGYCRRQVEGWSERYVRARTPNVPRFEKVIGWLAENVPDDAGIALIHNDFRLDNLVLDEGDPARIVGVLDWEMATLGDPLMDLGNSLAYWVEAADGPLFRALRRQPTHLPGMLTRREVIARYAERTGYAPRSWTFYEVFGLFRLAGIAQQIYYRYHRKETRNPAFRFFWIYVHLLHRRCLKRLRRSIP